MRGRECGRGRTHLCGEMGCVPYRCRAPQQGDTPLQLALFHENEEAVAKLLDAGAAGVSKDASEKVRGGLRYANRK